MYYSLAEKIMFSGLASYPLVVLSQAAPDGFDITELVRYGVLGVVLILVMTGHLRLKREVEERDRRLEKQDVVIENYRSMYERDVIPVLHNVVELMREIREDRRRGGPDDH